MTRCYVNPEPEKNPGLTQRNVVMAIRDYEAERQPRHSIYPRAVTDIELCNYIEYLYIVAGKHNRFRTHPEYKKGIEIRCQNRDEAEYLDRLMWDRCTTVVKYKVTYFSPA